MDLTLSDESVGQAVYFGAQNPGKLPADWIEQTIGQFCAVKTGPFGTLLKASEYSELDGVPVISVGEVREGHFRITEHTPLVPDAVQRRLPQYLLQAGDVVFGRKGAVERSALVRQSQAGWFLGSDGIAVRPTGSHCPEYVAAQFQSFRVRQWLLLNSTGTTMASMNQGVLSRVSIPFPPTLAEEQVIAEALTDADALIDSIAQLLTKKRQIKQGAMQELLTGGRRLLPGAATWREVPLGTLGRWSGGMTPSMSRPDYWSPQEVPWLSSGDIKTARLSDSAKAISTHAVSDGATTMVPAESVVVVMRSGILRKYFPVAMTLKAMAINQDLKALQPNGDALPEFLLHALTYSGERILATCLKAGTTVESIEFGWLKQFTINLPSVPEQKAITQVLSDMDADLTALESRLTKAQALKQAMAQALLTGRIRLVERQDTQPA